MDPGWDHTENEDKLLLAHTLGMAQDMVTVTNNDMYGFQVRSVSGSGCSDDNTTSNYEIISLSSEYNRHISTISCNILNANQNSLSTLDINSITYFYLFYQKLIKVFPNILYLNYLRFVYILNKYINGSFIRFKSNVTYLSCISSTLSSHSSKIQSLSDLIPEFEGLINNILCNLKSAIGLNITLLSLKISNIDKSIKCCQKILGESIKIICAINKLTDTKCNTDIIKSFKKCLKQIMCQLRHLYSELHKLYDKYGYINYLRIEAQNIINSREDIPTLKPKICELTKRYKCSICEFPKIESLINCIKTKIPEINKKKPELCKIFDQVYLLICVCSSNDNSIEILIINVDSIKKNIKCLTGKIEKICSEFEKIEDNSIKLKHSLLFNVHYFEISSYILDQLQCIETQQKTVSQKLSELKNIPSQISDISGNVNYVKSMIEKVYERRDDLEYVRDSLRSIIPKLCEIKEKAKCIIGVECVFEPLNKIKSSIDNLKKEEYDRVCLRILECYDDISIETVTCITDKLDIKSITSRLSTVQNGISSLESVICNSKKLETCMESLVNKMNYIVQWIDEVEKCLDNVIKRFIQCSLQSLSTDLTSLNSRISDRSNIRDAEVDNPVMSIYSLMSVMDYGVVVNRLCELSKKIDQILQLIPWPDGCRCILGLERSNKIDLGTMNVKKIMEEMTKKNNNQNDSLKLDKIRTLIQNDIKDNHLCLCMVFKYILYPQIINLTYMMSVDLRALSTISRKFSKYRLTTGYKENLSQFLIIMVDILEWISNWIRNTYKYAMIVDPRRVEIKCFCMYSDDPNYSRVVSIMLVLSSLMENIWTMDIETLRMTIQYLSTLYSQLESYDLSSVNDPKKLSCTSVFTLLINKQCQDKAKCGCKEGANGCSCWCVSWFNLLVMCINLCIQCKLCKAICNKTQNGCKKVEKFCEVVKCECECPEPKDGLCCLLKLALSGVVGCSEEITKTFEDCCKSCAEKDACCKKILDNVKAGKSKLLLLGCNSNCSIDGDLKRYCILFDNGSTSVAVVIFCKCGDPSKCCFLYTLVDKCKTNMKKICEGQDCCCKELLSGCKELCCGTDCTDCVCNKLKDSLANICGNNDCLCKKLNDIKDCLTKCVEGKCECKNKGGCCRCPCCKIVGQSVGLLTRACKANMVEPYKRIVLELLSCSKDKPELVRQITKSINNTTLNNIYLVKNSYSSYPYSVGSYPSKINSVTNVETRNWGYDTKYEHDVSNDKGFRRGDQYPHVSHRIRTGDSNGMSGNKAFKMILSKLLITS